jgi:hypothetical protein
LKYKEEEHGRTFCLVKKNNEALKAQQANRNMYRHKIKLLIDE